MIFSSVDIVNTTNTLPNGTVQISFHTIKRGNYSVIVQNSAGNFTGSPFYFTVNPGITCIFLCVLAYIFQLGLVSTSTSAVSLPSSNQMLVDTNSSISINLLDSYLHGSVPSRLYCY